MKTIREPGSKHPIKFMNSREYIVASREGGVSLDERNSGPEGN